MNRTKKNRFFKMILTVMLAAVLALMGPLQIFADETLPAVEQEQTAGDQTPAAEDGQTAADPQAAEEPQAGEEAQTVEEVQTVEEAQTGEETQTVEEAQSEEESVSEEETASEEEKQTEEETTTEKETKKESKDSKKDGKTYISDVMVGMGTTSDEALKALTGAGFTAVTDDKGNPVNVNEGAGSAFKTEKYVYIGYTTTDDPNEAITDLATMNMDGGYSFSDYRALMDKYRDSQIRPFIDKFMATIKEYRENYNSSNPGNKARADYAYEVLSHIIEDDSRNNMGELLLKPTREEKGLSDDQYKALSDGEKANMVNLTTALMQGNSDVIYLLEQTLAMAADTNETSWLERFSELGPDGLMNAYAKEGIRPADAEREMASLYDDSAKIILNGWEDLRSKLLSFEQSVSKAVGTEEKTEETDFTDIVQIGAEEEEQEDPDPASVDSEEAMGEALHAMEIAAEGTEQVNDTRIAVVYEYLKTAPYGEGTMFDFFTLPYADVSGENSAALYPMVSCLSAGQVAGLEYIPIELLLQIGAGGTDVFLNLEENGSDLENVIRNVGTVSIYLNVNREIFSDCTALTNEALRKNAEDGSGWMTPDKDLLGLSKVTKLTWASAAVAAIGTGISAYKYAQEVKAVAAYNTMVKHWSVVKERIFDMTASLRSDCEYPYMLVNGAFKMKAEEVPEGLRVTLEVSEDYMTGSKSEIFGINSGITTDMKTIEDVEKAVYEVKEVSKFWRKIEVGFGIVFAALAVASIILTAYDIYHYYNVDYTPIPKYIVDEEDITTLDAQGNRIVVRNDTAYYTVALTNRPKDADHWTSLKEYSDLNGDVGQQWLALYYVKSPSGTPILADSFKVVTGTTSIPDGYTTGIHMFGSNAAANLTDSNYTYNDDKNGIYVYYKNVPAAASGAASTFSAGTAAIFGGIGVAAGILLGFLIFGRRKKRAGEQEA